MQPALALLLLGAGSSPPSLSGPWVANGARLELNQDGATVVGKLASPGGPCPVEVGTELLRGSLLDDSLAAQVRLCLVNETCGDNPGTALAMLLVTTQLTGGVHATAPCAADARALTLRKPGSARALTAPLANERLSRTRIPRKLKTGSAATGSPADARAERDRIAAHAHIEFPASPSSQLAQPMNTQSPTQIAPAGMTPAQSGTPAAQPQPSAEGQYDPRDASGDSTTNAAALLAAESVDSLLQRALAELKEGRFESARTRFRQAVAKDPTRAEAYNGVGVSYYARGDLDEALAWYKRSLEADPRFGDAYYNVACIYALEGHKALAFRYLRLAALDGYSEKAQLLEDPDLVSLRGEAEMSEIIEQMASPKSSQPAKGAVPP